MAVCELSAPVKAIAPAPRHRCTRVRMTMLGQPYRISKRSGTNWHIFESDDECLSSTPVAFAIDVPKVTPLYDLQFPV